MSKLSVLQEIEARCRHQIQVNGKIPPLDGYFDIITLSPRAMAELKVELTHIFSCCNEHLDKEEFILHGMLIRKAENYIP